MNLPDCILSSSNRCATDRKMSVSLDTFALCISDVLKESFYGYRWNEQSIKKELNQLNQLKKCRRTKKAPPW